MQHAYVPLYDISALCYLERDRGNTAAALQRDREETVDSPRPLFVLFKSGMTASCTFERGLIVDSLSV